MNYGYYLCVYILMLTVIITFYCLLPKKNKHRRFVKISFEDDMFGSPVCYDRNKKILYRLNAFQSALQVSDLPKEVHRKTFLMMVKNLKRRKVKYEQTYHDELPEVWSEC